MVTVKELQFLKKLKLKKYRDSENKFLVEGKRLVSEGLTSHFTCSGLYYTSEFEEREADFLLTLKKFKISSELIKSREFEKITSTKNPQGIAAVFEKNEIKELENDADLIICLENISDPGNVGTVLRSCDWFGFKNVILSKNCAELYNPKVLRATMGAIFNLNIIEDTDLIEKLKSLKSNKYKIYCADMDGTDYRELKIGRKSAIVFCNEAFGPSEELLEVCNQIITIPKKGRVESLNVAAAAAVILSQIQ